MAGPLPDQHAAILAQKLMDGQLALFVGGGLSRQAIARDGSGRRLPLWKELAEQVAKACHEDLNIYGGNILDLFDAIVYGQSRFTLEEAVRSALDDKAFDPSPAHQALAELPWAAVYTTNYDGLLGRMLNADPVSEDKQYDRLQLSADKQPRLFHVYGTLAWPHTLTLEDYRLWPEKHPRAFLHLQHFLRYKTALFVGYSLSDPHLADGILPTVRKITAGRNNRLYAWMWKSPRNQVQLLDLRDAIEAISIVRGGDWAAAFRQVEAAFRQLEDALREVRQPLVVKPVLGKPKTRRAVEAEAARVPKVFISYAREDRAKAQQLARVFEERGWSVWWDTRLKAGEVWDEVIERELTAARCVVVLWSRNSIGKHWVRVEANEGLQRGILIPALIEDVRPPLAFRLVQAEFLIDWSGDRSDAGLVRLLAAIGDRLEE